MVSTKLFTKAKFDFSFESLLGDISIEEFVGKYWEENTLLVERENSSFYSDLLTMGDLDKIFDMHKPDSKGFRLVTPDGFVDSERYLTKDGRINLNLVYSYYADGQSIQMIRLNHIWNPINKMCFNFRKATSHNFNVNMYLTPKNSVAFTPHTDTHDVFILQIAGRKEWQVYDSPYETPLIEHKALSPLNPNKLSGKRDITLKAGDLLYIPKGVPHNAYTAPDESSLHLTVGMYPVQWLDLVREFMLSEASKRVELRKALPFGYLKNQDKLPEIKDKLQSLITNTKVNGSFEEVIDKLENDLRIIQTPIADGHFASLDKISELNLNSKLIKRSNITCKVVDIPEAPEFCRLIFNGNSIRGPQKVRDAFDFFATVEDVFTPDSLPIENQKHKLTLCKKFVRGGLLQVL